jgi:hypothetical protein
MTKTNNIVKLNTQYETTNAIIKHLHKFIDLNPTGRLLLIAISSTIGGSFSEVKKNFSHYSKLTGLKRETIRDSWLKLVELGYIRETTNRLGDSAAYINKERLINIVEGLIQPQKYKRHAAKGAAKQAKTAVTPASSPNPVEEAKPTVTPVTSSKPAEAIQTDDVEKAKEEDRKLVKDYNRVMGTDYRYNIHGVMNMKTNSIISYETLRENLKLKEEVE